MMFSETWGGQSHWPSILVPFSMFHVCLNVLTTSIGRNLKFKGRPVVLVGTYGMGACA